MFIRTKNCYLSNDKDFLFQSSSTSIIDFDFEKKIIIYVMNVIISIIYVKNAIVKTIVLSKHIKLNHITNFEKKECYHINLKNAHLTIKMNWKRKTLNKFIAIASLAMLAIFSIIARLSFLNRFKESLNII